MNSDLHFVIVSLDGVSMSRQRYLGQIGFDGTTGETTTIHRRTTGQKDDDVQIENLCLAGIC